VLLYCNTSGEERKLSLFEIHLASGGWYVCRHCETAAPPIFILYFAFRSVYCFTLIFSSACTSVDNVHTLAIRPVLAHSPRRVARNFHIRGKQQLGLNI